MRDVIHLTVKRLLECWANIVQALIKQPTVCVPYRNHRGNDEMTTRPERVHDSFRSALRAAAMYALIAAPLLRESDLSPRALPDFVCLARTYVAILVASGAL